MIRKRVVLVELPNGQLGARYQVHITCDRCPSIISIKTVSGEALDAIESERQVCDACNLRELGLSSLVERSAAK